ncbi:MAG TPA: transposase [Roseiflexaceae bacterium]|nr:transposase [Roseiflexaceae bacterium]
MVGARTPRRPTEIDLRAIVNALRYMKRTGCQWRLIPADYPTKGSVRSYLTSSRPGVTFVRVLNKVIIPRGWRVEGH